MIVRRIAPAGHVVRWLAGQYVGPKVEEAL